MSYPTYSDDPEINQRITDEIAALDICDGQPRQTAWLQGGYRIAVAVKDGVTINVIMEPT